MLLEKLKEYADERLDTRPSLYAPTPVAWVVELDPDGRPLSPKPTSRIDATTTRGRRGLDMLAPEVVRGVDIKPLLLADNGEYTFGIARDPAKQARAKAAHKAYLELLNQCAAATAEPAVRATQQFYQRGGPTLLDLGDDWDFGLKVTFRVHLAAEAVIPIQLPAVQAFWADCNAPTVAEADKLDCIVCGNRRQVLDRLQGKIKGIRGGQSSGTSIISANAKAFESYGLEASRIAPTCANCGEQFTVGLNELLGNDANHFSIGNATVVYWTRKPTGFSLKILTNPQAGDVEALLSAVRRGKPPGPFDDIAFYAAAFSGSGGRAVVRDWLDTTVGQAMRQVGRWFRLQEIVQPDGKPHQPLGLFALAASTVRRIDDLSPAASRALLHASITGAPVPMELAFEAVRRNRAEQTITRPRAALVKLVLLSQEREEQEDRMVSLEADHPDEAYQLGRLLAVLEEVQRAALPGVNASIIDRFFGTASSAPAGVFGRLLRGAQPHLAKLERDRRGAYVSLQRRLEDVCSRVDSFPRTLTLEQQALFALGYYHQRAHDRAEMAAARDAKNTTQTSNNEEPENE